MLPGYNHNIKYKDRVYHVQTEDSGVANPHLITHLFFGGNIIFSQKTSYDDIVQRPDLAEQLATMMQAQHKTVLKDLIRGRFDADIAVRSVNAATLDGPAPLNVEAGAQHRSSLGMRGGGGGAPPPPPPVEAPSAAAPPPAAASPLPLPLPLPLPPPEAAAETPLSSFFGSAPPAKIIEASALQAAFESQDDKAVDSIFGISEKSLDEVILSYLSDDEP